MPVEGPTMRTVTNDGATVKFPSDYGGVRIVQTPPFAVRGLMG